MGSPAYYLRRRAALGHEPTFATPLRHVWKAAITGHSASNVGNAPVSFARCADYRSAIISGHIRAKYAPAREEQADFYADEIVTIADTEPDAAISRVRIDALADQYADQYARARLLQADALASNIARARARDLQADALDDDIAGVVEEIRNGTLDANAGRVIIWAHQWRASKMRPTRYSDKLDLKHSGSLTIGIRHNDRVAE